MDEQRYMAMATGWGQDHIHLWQLREMVREADRHGYPEDSNVELVYDQNYLRERLAIVDNPRRRCVHAAQTPLTPVEMAVASKGEREFSLTFHRDPAQRQSVTVRIRVQDAGSGTTMADIELTEHQFALAMSGSVLTVKDNA